MKTEATILIENDLNQKWLNVEFPSLCENEFVILTIYNDKGEHLLVLKLSGTKHKIDLTYLRVEHGNIKVETPNSVMMKKIF